MDMKQEVPAPPDQFAEKEQRILARKARSESRRKRRRKKRLRKKIKKYIEFRKWFYQLFVKKIIS